MVVVAHLLKDAQELPLLKVDPVWNLVKLLVVV